MFTKISDKTKLEGFGALARLGLVPRMSLRSGLKKMKFNTDKYKRTPVGYNQSELFRQKTTWIDYTYQIKI